MLCLKNVTYHFHSRKCIWNYRLQNAGYFVSVSTCKIYSTHWGRDKMAVISQATLSSAFSWKKMSEFRLKFHWSLFLRVQLTIFQHWFRQWLGADQATSHYLNQWWLVHWHIYASLGLNELNSAHTDAFLLELYCQYGDQAILNEYLNHTRIIKMTHCNVSVYSYIIIELWIPIMYSEDLMIWSSDVIRLTRWSRCLHSDWV